MNFYPFMCGKDLQIEVLRPYEGQVYDPCCCGSGGMFVQSARFVENHQGNIRNISIYGQDSNATTWKMCTMNLAIRSLEADLGPVQCRYLLGDCHPAGS